MVLNIFCRQTFARNSHSRFSSYKKILRSVNPNRPIDIDKEIADLLSSQNRINDNLPMNEPTDPFAERIAKIVKEQMTKPFVRKNSPYE